MVSRPTDMGGLGFGMKWNMGWMHDSLKYMSMDPLFRKYHHDKLTFSVWYAFTENFMLPLSHDEVVHGKGALIGKMPGDEWQSTANLKIMYGYMYGHPGKKLLFMGCEFAQWKEWDHDESIEWHVADLEFHAGVKNWVRDLNHLYRNELALHELDFSKEGFSWIDFQDWEQSIISFIRKSETTDETILVVCNFTNVPRYDYRVAVPHGGYWREILNSDSKMYAGSDCGNSGGAEASPEHAEGRDFSLSLTLPPLGILFLKK
jgi:1,4-alpha-glucan branching enzyme